ncbi:MAG TPA: hypothetical protein VMF52_03870 [Steroidobacteraceae bacterium]|nr:hypothetical protein [Steroidobacteraceae bacterium]
MITICRALLACVLCISVCRADTGVLVEHVPHGAEPAIVLAVVKQALINRAWTVRLVEGNHVDADISHGQIEARIRIELSQNRLTYEGSSRRMLPTGPQGQKVLREGETPKRWLEYLRRDISSILATMPEHR